MYLMWNVSEIGFIENEVDFDEDLVSRYFPNIFFYGPTKSDIYNKNQGRMISIYSKNLNSFNEIDYMGWEKAECVGKLWSS